MEADRAAYEAHLHIPPQEDSVAGLKIYNAPVANAGVNMAAQIDALKNRLTKHREIDISVIGRKSGRTISIPVWFVFEDGHLYLLPVQGSDTQWYKNVQKKPSIRINVGDVSAESKVVLITDAKQVASVVEKFRAKYGTNDVKRYYSKFNVAVLVQMG
jgi:deazaflavin-dependent oxidoreductase (nitroreductase family)